MRVFALKAGILLATALVSTTALHPALAGERKVTCLCDCPDDHKVKAHRAEHVVMRKMVRRAVRPRTREEYFYSYNSAAPVMMGGWHGEWHVAPNDGQVPPMGPAYGPPMAYGPPPGAYYGPGPDVAIDDRGFTGGVGYMADGGGGGGGGFVDGFGQVHFAQGGGTENGPTYNSYGQSFQYNPSVAGPFVPQRMGGPAPVSSK